MASPASTEPFPSLPRSPGATRAPKGAAPPSKPADSKTEPLALERKKSSSSAISRRRRTLSSSESFLNSSPPYGMWQATGEVASKVPTLGEIRNGSFCADGWTEEGQMQGRGETPHQIQRRRTSRASSLSASRQRRSTTSPLSTRLGEQEDFFPIVDYQVSDEANGVPSTIPEGSGIETRRANM